MEEAIDQLTPMNVAIDIMLFASSSAGTQAGLVLGATVRKFSGRVLGISIDSTEGRIESACDGIGLGSGAIAKAGVGAAQLPRWT
jgi:D-cysteine desulfhydrase